jgi:hypothetical protein
LVGVLLKVAKFVIQPNAHLAFFDRPLHGQEHLGLSPLPLALCGKVRRFSIG